MPYLKQAGFVLAVFAIVAFAQTNLMQLPVVGPYLPGGKPPAA